MIPLVPRQIQRHPKTQQASLALHLTSCRQFLSVCLPDEQARLLALELHGLASDRCGQHHLAMAIAHSLGARVEAVVLRATTDGQITAAVHLETRSEPQRVAVSVPAALSMAIHLAVPLFFDEEGGSPHQPSNASGQHQSLSDVPQVFLRALEESDQADN